LFRLTIFSVRVTKDMRFVIGALSVFLFVQSWNALAIVGDEATH